MTSDASPPALRTIRLEEVVLADEGQASIEDDTPHRPVYVVRGEWDEKKVLVKKLLPECRQDLLRQCLTTWRDIKHPNVVSVCAVSSASEEPLFLVLPYHENGNLSDWVLKNNELDRNQLILDVAFGMQYLHGRNVVHGSLMPSNILVNQHGRACVADYDMLQLQSSRNDEAHRYLSPEGWKGTTSKASDVFAFAMCAYELFSSSPPWGVLSEQRIYRLVVLEDARPDRPDSELSQRHGLNNKIWSIIEEAWAKEARLRPSFDILLRIWRDTGLEESSYGAEGEQRISPDPAAFDSMDRRPGSLPRDSFVSAGPPAYEDNTPTVVQNPQPSPGYSDYTRVTGTPNPPSETNASETFPTGKVSNRFVVMNQVSGTPPPLQPPASSSGTSSSSSRGKKRSRGLGTPPTTLPPLRVLPKQSFLSLHSSTGTSSSVPSRAPSIQRSVRSAPAPRRQFSLDSQLTSESESYHTPRSPGTFSNLEGDLLRALPTMSRAESMQLWEDTRRRTLTSPASVRVDRQYTQNYSFPSPGRELGTISDVGEDVAGRSIMSNSQSSSRSTAGARPSALLLVQALQAEMREGRKTDSIDGYLIKMYESTLESDKEAFKLVNAGAVPLLIHLLRTRAADDYGVELVLIVLGMLAHDSISANTVYRTGTAITLIELSLSAPTDEVTILAIWCLARITRTLEVAQGLIKQNLISILLRTTSRLDLMISNMSLYCLGTLIQSDGLAELMASMGAIPVIANHLRLATASPVPSSDAICSSIYAVARLSRSIKLAKGMAKAGCVELIAYHLKNSNDPDVLHWSARAVGCLMRPSSNDMAKMLLEADIARGLARLPTVLPASSLHPLGSFGFAIQRFSCAEWGGSTRKALVDAGVVDSLLAALRVAAEGECFDVHVELALGISLLGDVGGAAIRKEIVNAGGIDILKLVGTRGGSEVSKACNMAITSITGNLFSRNAASAKTAMAHNWSGGCPAYYPPCPLIIGLEEEELELDTMES